MTAVAAAVLGPLVEPGPPLSRAELDRYSRHVLLPDLGELGQRRLRRARVAVIGAGGLGAPVLTYLAAAGVGTIGVVDFDLVEASNLQRQTIHGVADVGRPKVHSAVETLGLLDPSVIVEPIAVRLAADNVMSVLASYDLVIDGTDNFATRYLVNDACALLGIPYVWGSVFRFEGQVSVFWAARGPQYRDLFPAPPPPGSVPSCGEGGVLGVVCGVIGSVMATEAVKLITGVGRPLLGRVLIYDALQMSFRTVAVRRDPAAAPIVGLVDYEQWCGSTAGTAADPDTDITAPELIRLCSTGAQVTVVDVREPGEHVLGTVPGAVFIPMQELASESALTAIREATRTGPVVVYCASGVRSARAVDLLQARGIGPVLSLAGGFAAWAHATPATEPRA